MSGGYACSKERYFGAFSELSRRMGYGGKDTTINYMNCLEILIL